MEVQIAQYWGWFSIPISVSEYQSRKSYHPLLRSLARLAKNKMNFLLMLCLRKLLIVCSLGLDAKMKLKIHWLTQLLCSNSVWKTAHYLWHVRATSLQMKANKIWIEGRVDRVSNVWDRLSYWDRFKSQDRVPAEDWDPKNWQFPDHRFQLGKAGKEVEKEATFGVLFWFWFWFSINVVLL